ASRARPLRRPAHHLPPPREGTGVPAGVSTPPKRGAACQAGTRPAPGVTSMSRGGAPERGAGAPLPGCARPRRRRRPRLARLLLGLAAVSVFDVSCLVPPDFSIAPEVN